MFIALLSSFLSLLCYSSQGFLIESHGLRYLNPKISTAKILSKNMYSITTDNKEFKGLLSGISNISTADYYSNNISIVEAMNLVGDQKILHHIIESYGGSDPVKANAFYDTMFQTMSDFIYKNTVWDRKELLDGLEDLIKTKGKLVCLLGGKSTGKSFVLKHFSRIEKKNKKVIYINMRGGYSSIVARFVEVMKNENGFLDLLKAVVKVVLETKTTLKFSEISSETSLLPLLKLISDDGMTPMTLFENLIERMINNEPKSVITLVVDEANLPFTINDRTSETKIEEVKAALALFTRLTKEEKKVRSKYITTKSIF
jgi:hypothetical protein